MFELNSKPKRLTVQKHSNANLWTTVCVFSKGEGDNSSFTEEEVSNIIDLYNDTVHSIRVLNEHGKVILSTASMNFCMGVCSYTKISVGGMIDEAYIEDENGKKSIEKLGIKEGLVDFTCFKNPHITHIREFQRYIARRGGIKRWVEYPRDANDGYIRCGKLTFKDGTSVTVSYFD